MEFAEFVKGLGVVVSLLWAAQKIIDDVRTWRGGSPELRVIREQLVNSNDRIHTLLERIVERLDRDGR